MNYKERYIMSGSSHEGKNITETFLRGHRDEIKTLIDVGPGRARYGLMARWVGIKNLTAIEIFKPYAEVYNYKYIYDTVIIDDISKVDLPDGDCIVFGDVLEHLPKDKAIKVFNKANAKYKHLILSIPTIVLPQGESEGNVSETHLSQWTFEEVSELCKDFPIKLKYPITSLFIR